MENMKIREKENAQSKKGTSFPHLKMTVLYDNYVFHEGTQNKWGFSCLIEGTEKTILFDTGGEGDVLMKNMEVLGVDPAVIDLVVISHNHWDHIGGLETFLKQKNKIPVYVLESFPDDVKERVGKAGGNVIAVRDAVKLCEHVHLTGELGTRIPEQSLLLETVKGTVVVTGCSHPGIVYILEKAHEILPKDIYLVFGGFHLMDRSDSQMGQIIDAFRNLGVKKCGATHCTGDHQIELFREAFGDDYMSIGVGRVIEID